MAVITAAILSSLGGTVIGWVQDSLVSRKEAKQKKVDKELELKIWKEKQSLLFSQELEKQKLTQANTLEKQKLNIQESSNVLLTEGEKTAQKDIDLEMKRFEAIEKTSGESIRASTSKWINFASFIKATTRPILSYMFSIPCLMIGIIAVNKAGLDAKATQEYITSLLYTTNGIIGYWFCLRSLDKRKK